MSKSDAFENAFLLLIFNNTNIANLGDATGVRGSAVAGSIYGSLHTADPGEAGNQSTSEIAYTGYTRVAIARSAAGFTVTGNSVVPFAAITFGTMTAGAGGTVTFACLGRDAAGAGMILYSGAVTPNIVVANGVTPSLTTASSVLED